MSINVKFLESMLLKSCVTQKFNKDKNFTHTLLPEWFYEKYFFVILIVGLWQKYQKMAPKL